MSVRTTCRSAEWTGTEFRIEELPLTEPGPGEVRIDVAACSVCLTEVHHVDGFYNFGFTGRMGHEFGGTVEAVGPGVEGLSIGTPVGVVGGIGGFGDAVVAPASVCYPLPDSVPVHHACFVEPISSLIHAVRRGRVPLGSTVLVTGAGTNGLLILQLALRCGAARAIVSEPDPTRREFAARLGADEVFDPTAMPLKEALGGTRIDVAFETSGHPAGVQDCLDVVATAGRVVLFGVSADTAKLELPLLAFHMRDLELVASMGHDPDGPAIAAAFLPALELESLITHRFGLDDIGRAFEAARSGAGMKSVVFPRGLEA